MKNRHFLLAFLSLSVGLAGSRSAWAQTVPSVTGILGAVQRCEPSSATCVSADGAGENPHPPGVPVNVVNFEDCSADLSYDLSLGIASPSASYQLEAWVGTQDCSQLANRQSEATSVCWPVAPFQTATVNPFVLDVRMQDIAAGLASTIHPVTYQPATDPSVCQSTQDGATNVTLYLFFVDAGSNPVGTVQQYPIMFDTRAADVQGVITVTPGATGLVVNIPSSTDPDTQGYNVYCDPPPGQTGGSDAGDVSAPSGAACSSAALGGGAGGDGGATDAGDGGVALAGGAMPAGFQYGQALGQKYLCGNATATATTIEVGNVKAGSAYAVAVAAVDAVGNVGPLSNVACGDEASSGAASATDGSGGGMSCSTRGAGGPAGSGGFGALLIASIATLLRKRRRS